MKNTTLTQENLQAIYTAMQVIKENDRSDYFKNYYTEVVERLLDEIKLNEMRTPTKTNTIKKETI